MQFTPEAGTLVLRGRAHWATCALQDLVVAGDVLQLRALPPDAPAALGAAPDAVMAFAGLAFDRLCRLFHARPAAGQIEQVLWGTTTATGVRGDTPAPWPVTAAGTEVNGVPTGALPQRPTALAVAASDFLAVADPQAMCVWLIDLWQQEVARHIAFDAAPLDLATLGDEVYVLLANGSTWRLDLCDAPQRTAWPLRPGAQRLVLASGAAAGRDAPRGWVLVGAGTAGTTLQALHRTRSLPAPQASDIVIESQDDDGRTVFVIAQRPGEAFLRLQWTPGTAGDGIALLGALIAPHYDGAGIAVAPDGRIAYWTVHGRLRHAAPARGHFASEGRLYGFALDSGQDQCRWGRLQVQACVPPGTSLSLRAFSADDLDAQAAVVPVLPLQPLAGAAALPLLLWQQRDEATQPLFRDPSPRPLQAPPEDGFAWFDAPVPAGPGRYLWLVFDFRGTRSQSPRLREVQAEFPGHGLLQQLPRTLWRDAAAQQFLHRLLMPVAAVLDEWAAVSDARHRLLDVRTTPATALPWLAGFVGLVLEPCWSEVAQRRLIGAAARLFRTRGTLASLREMLQLLTGAEVQIIEAFRLRGGGVIGNPEAAASQAVLGGGFRVGGMIGEVGPGPIEGVDEPDFDDFAHRYTVVIHARLDDTQMEGARRLLAHHQPAHTDFTLCTAEAGLRAGLGGHVGMTAIVGRSGRFEPALLGDAVLGGGMVLGRPALEARLDGGGDSGGNDGPRGGSGGGGGGGGGDGRGGGGVRGGGVSKSPGAGGAA